MKNRWKRLTAAALALVLAGSLTLPALADTPESAPGPQEGQAALLDVTAGTYAPAITVQPNALYTLIALPFAADPPQVLTAADLVSASGSALFIGSATANAQGKLTFQDVRLRTAEAAVYYVTGPGLEPPYREATGASTRAEGSVRTASQDSSAAITLVDKETDYRYNTGIYADGTGYYSTGHLAPGKYKLRVEKPGYLPYLSASENDYLDVTSGESVYHDVDISANVGDVNGDGARDMTDLAALLTYYGGSAPQDITADLDYSGQVDAQDAALLARHLTTGTQTDVTEAAISVRDEGGNSTTGLRRLSFELETRATVSAAAFSLTFQSRDVQLLTPQGGLMAPVDGSSLASCLLPADGFTARLVSWKVDGEQTTLSFCVTTDTPRSANQVARLYYRPASGSTDSFYNGVFQLTHAAALVGKDTVVTRSSLTYPGCDELLLDSISIDQAAQSQPLSMIIPAAEHTNVLLLSATGYQGADQHKDLSGLDWKVTRTDGKSLEGISVSRGLVTLTSSAAPGTIQVTAAWGDLTTQPVEIQLKLAPPEAASVQILKDGAPCQHDRFVFEGDFSSHLTYTARVLDQYGVPLAQQPTLTWTVLDGPDNLYFDKGVLSFPRSLYERFPNHNWTLRLLAETATGLQGTLELELVFARMPDTIYDYVVDGPTCVTIPAQGEGPVSAKYIILGERNGQVFELSKEDVPYFGPANGQSFPGVTVTQEVMDGSYTVTVTDQADPAVNYFVVGDPNGSPNYYLTHLSPEDDRDAARAAIYYKEEPLQVSHVTVSAGSPTTLPFTAQMLDREGAVATFQPKSWSWSGGSASNSNYFQVSKNGVLTVGKDTPPGTYAVAVSVAAPDEITYPTATGIVYLTTAYLFVDVVPSALNKLELASPPALTIPTAQELRYTLALTGQDAAGNRVELPQDLKWNISRQGLSLTGIRVENGVLIVAPSAIPGDATVTVTDPTTGVSTSAQVTLNSSGSDQILSLYRQITVDGSVTQPSAPVLAAGDTLHLKEGQSAVISYTAMLVDQSTNKATPIPSDQVKWLGSQNVFTVDDKAQVGVYTAEPVAVYNGLSATASATVSVYPNITGLRLDFGTGHDPEPPYTLVVPSGTPQVYTAAVMATIQREGRSLQVPLRELGLADYELAVNCYYTGVYATLDKAAGALSFTVDPVAIQNPMADDTSNPELQVLGLTLRYFPGDSLELDPIPFYLSKETLTPRNAFLRRGQRTGSRFTFDTPKEDQIAIPTGILDLPCDVFSSCYALELLDQYNRPITGQGDVVWSLTGSPKDAQGKFLVTLFSPGEATEQLHANYSSIRRLRVSAQTPEGTYPLTLSATCGDFTRSLNITLSITAGEVPTYRVALPECGQQIIPRTYKSYNSTTFNDGVRSVPIAPILYTDGGLELDPKSHTAQWSVTHSQGKEPTGVSVVTTEGSTTQATVCIDRTAKTTNLTLDDFLSVNVEVKTPDGKTVGKADSTLELVRDNPVPTIMQVTQGGKAIAQDSVTMNASQTVTRTYNFALWDQYGLNRIPQATQAKVEWRIVNPTGSGVSHKVDRDEKTNIPTLTLTIAKPSRSVELQLTAAITVPDANATGGQVVVYRQIPLKITVKDNDSSGGGGGGGGGGGNTDLDNKGDTATAGPPATLTINGSTTLSATQGSQASRTFTATLRDANGKACALSYDTKVTWSATGLSGGLTFNTSTHVLTVPATVAPGTYTVSITATYSASVRQTVKVTVTVKAKDGATTAPTDVTLAPPVTKNGVAGTAALTASQEQALLAATGVSGGTVTIVPSGGEGLSSLSVSLTASTATAIAAQRNQSLRIQCHLGTVLLSPEALKALAARGGKTATITISSDASGLKVDFSCGTTATSLPGVISLNAYATGNVALKVDANGAATVLKKALVEEGKIYTHLSGSTLLKLETRAANFADTKGHWAQSAIDFTVARELFQGTSATTFEPGGNMTRSMVVTVLHRLEDTPTPATAAQFADVAQNSWYTSAVSWANAKGIVQGTNAGFKPNDPVTREQLATILYRYVNAQGLSTTGRGSLGAFSDQSKVSSWARDAMEWAVGQGLINGKSGGLLDPGGYASRAEVSTILERLIRSMVPVV